MVLAASAAAPLAATAAVAEPVVGEVQALAALAERAPTVDEVIAVVGAEAVQALGFGDGRRHPPRPAAVVGVAVVVGVVRVDVLVLSLGDGGRPLARGDFARALVGEV